LARISLDEGRTLLVIAELRRLVSEDAENPEFNYYMGLAHLARNEGAAAGASFKAALAIDPFFKPAVIKIVEIYFSKEFFVDAERIINEFLALNPDDPDVLLLQVECANRMSVVSGEG
jgi:predicted Zn-dependent protease